VTRPDELNTQNNRRRKGYSQLWTYHQFLDYARANQAPIEQAIKEAIEFQTSNTGRIVFRGSRPIPAFPAPHPGQDPPPEENPSPDQILEDPPCGYLLSEEQYNGPRTDGATTVAQRIEAHGWSVHRRRGAQQGYLVSMFQPERGLIPLLLDAQAAEELVDAQRMYPPPGFPEGEPVPPGACGRGVPAPSAEGAGYDLDYVTD
jgi:hypothetical protein